MAEAHVDVAQESTSQEILSKLNEGGTSVIKSIQRGVAYGSRNATEEINITISSVNPDKCFVLLHNQALACVVGSDSSGETYGAYLISLTTNNLKIGVPSYESDWFFDFSWQLIEFC